jgi:predicted nucleotidyltransferase
MRLAPETIPALLRAVRESFTENADVWLFGSRTDDSKRGGDIDLYIETDIQHGIVTRRSDLRRKLEEIYGDRKIDLAIRPRSRAPHPLHEIARQHGILLNNVVPSEDLRGVTRQLPDPTRDTES